MVLPLSAWFTGGPVDELPQRRGPYLLPGFRQLPQRNRLQPKVLPWWKYSARRDAWAKTGPQGNSSDDDSPEISSRSSCDDDDDPSRGLQEIWTLQQLDKWCGWQIPRATTAGRAVSAPRPQVTKSGALIRRLGLVDPPGGPFLNRRGAPWVGNDPKSPKSGAFIRHLGLGIDPEGHEELVALGRKWP